MKTVFRTVQRNKIRARSFGHHVNLPVIPTLTPMEVLLSRAALREARQAAKRTPKGPATTQRTPKRLRQRRRASQTISHQLRHAQRGLTPTDAKGAKLWGRKMQRLANIATNFGTMRPPMDVA